MSLVELLYALLIALVAAGTGRRLLHRLGCSFGSRAEELCFALALGLGALALSVMVLGLVHLLYEVALYGVVVAWGAFGIRRTTGVRESLANQVRGFRPSARSFHSYLALVLLIGLLLNLVRALTPAYGPVDPLAYHLALPKIYLSKHYLSFERTVNGSLFPANIEMLFTLAIGLRSAVLAQVLHFGLGAASAVAVLVFGWRYFSWRVGLWAAAVFYFIPVLVFFSPFGYIDAGLCFYQLVAAWALFNWVRDPSRPNLALAAVLVGLSLGIKHSALALAATAGVVVAAASAARDRRALPVMGRIGGLALIALLLASPWYLRSYVAAGNPVWPYANGLFGGLAATQAEIASPGSEQPVAAAAEPRWTVGSVLEVAAYPVLFVWKWGRWAPPGTQHAIGVHLLALLPGLLLYLSNRRLRWLALFCYGYTIVAVLWIHGNPRYSLFLFGLLSVLAGYVADRLASNRVLRYPFAAVFLGSVLLSLLWIYQLARPGLMTVVGAETKEHFLLQNEVTYRVFRYVNTNLPSTATILIQGEVRGYYCDRPYLWDHPDQAVLVYALYREPEQLLGRMQELGITHIVRLLRMPPIRRGMYPEYFADPMQVEFARRYLRPVYWDETFVVYEIRGAGA